MYQALSPKIEILILLLCRGIFLLIIVLGFRCNAKTSKTSKCNIFICCLSLVQESAAEILSNVRFPLLSAEFLMDRVATEEIIRNNRACMYDELCFKQLC